MHVEALLGQAHVRDGAGELRALAQGGQVFRIDGRSDGYRVLAERDFADALHREDRAGIEFATG